MGLTKREFCQQRGISEEGIYYWRKSNQIGKAQSLHPGFYVIY